MMTKERVKEPLARCSRPKASAGSSRRAEAICAGQE